MFLLYENNINKSTSEIQASIVNSDLVAGLEKLGIIHLLARTREISLFPKAKKLITAQPACNTGLFACG